MKCKTCGRKLRGDNQSGFCPFHTQKRNKATKHIGEDREPTEQELEAIIAEQSANLPDWWDRETAEAHTAHE